jgi:hypothetical protein
MPAEREPYEFGPMDEGPSLFTMVKVVAVTVAVIILVSFAAGYGFGRLFL